MHGAPQSTPRCSREGGASRGAQADLAGRSYALLELPDRYDQSAVVAAVPEASRYDGADHRIGCFPCGARSLAAPARSPRRTRAPRRGSRQSPCAGGVIVEWDPQRVGVRVVLGLVDVELQPLQQRAHRRGAVAAAAWSRGRDRRAGLQAPEIEPARFSRLRIDACLAR